MNLHGIVAPIIGAVNPNYPVVFEASAGPVSNPDFSQSPSYAAPVTVTGQVQELTAKDLQKLEQLNIQQNSVAIYLYGIADGVVRVSQKGGDRITVPSGHAQTGVYIVATVIEQWPDWVKVAATLQNQAVT